MVRIYTDKALLKDKNVIYDVAKFFDNIVAKAIKNGEYPLMETDRRLIADVDNVVGITTDGIITTYGKLTFADLPIKAKTLITLRFVEFEAIGAVVNITNVGQYLKEILEEAENRDVAVFIMFKHFEYSWKDVKMQALFNGKETMAVCDYNQPFSVAYYTCFEDLTSDLRIAFKDENIVADFNLSNNLSRVKCNNEVQKNLLLKKLKQAVLSGDVTITGTNAMDFSNVALSRENVIFAEDYTCQQLKEKLSSNKTVPYILICDSDTHSPLDGNMIFNITLFYRISFTINDIDNYNYDVVENKRFGGDGNIAEFVFTLENNLNDKIDFSSFLDEE